MTSSIGPSAHTLSGYDFGLTTSYALQSDPRFSYCLYVPSRFRDQGERREARLLVAVHGTNRSNQALRELFIPLAERCGLFILSPLFPCGITAPHERDSYKYFTAPSPQYDMLLWSMIGEVEQRYDAAFPRLSLFGFSGGAHYAHRFAYLHPSRVEAVAVCAPGSPTLIDSEHDWWVGVRDFERRFGHPLDIAKLRQVRFHLAVGENDTDASEIIHAPGGAYYMPGANLSGRTRVERLEALAQSLRHAGLAPAFACLPGVGHQIEPLAASSAAFFESVYAPARGGEGIGGARQAPSGEQA